MRKLWTALRNQSQQNILATFGGARLVSNTDGSVELVGGTASDATEAKEWLSLFLHQALLRPSRASETGAK